jgi:hypothetical protein
VEYFLDAPLNCVGQITAARLRQVHWIRSKKLYSIPTQSNTCKKPTHSLSTIPTADTIKLFLFSLKLFSVECLWEWGAFDWRVSYGCGNVIIGVWRFLFCGSGQIFKTQTKTTFSQVTAETDFPAAQVTQFYVRSSMGYVRIFTTDTQNGCHETSVPL